MRAVEDPAGAVVRLVLLELSELVQLVCALRLMLDVTVDSGEVLRVESLLSDSSVDGAGDRVPRGTVVLPPVAALVRILVTRKSWELRWVCSLY